MAFSDYVKGHFFIVNIALPPFNGNSIWSTELTISRV